MCHWTANQQGYVCDLDHLTLRQCMADAGTAFCSHRRICHGFGGSGGMETGKADIRDGDHRDDQ